MKIKFIIFPILYFSISSAFSQWNTQTVTNSGDVGRQSHIAVDSEGFQHIVHSNSSGDLLHSYWTGTTWSTEDLNNNQSAYSFDINIDESNIIYIVYSDSQKNIRILTKHPGGSWTNIYTGLTSQTYDISISMAITYDSSPVDTIIYLAYNKNDNLYCSTYKINTGTATENLVDGNLKVGAYNDIVIDNNDHVHISYQDYNNSGKDLKYAFYNGNEWLTTIVDGLGSAVGQYTSIDVDSNNEAHISYYDFTNGQLLHVKISQ